MNKSGGRPKAHTTTISAVANGRFASNSEVRPLYPQEQTSSARPVWSESANNRLMRRGKRHLYSITSSVRASSIGERSTPEVTQRIDGRTIDVDDDHLQVGWCGPTQPLVAGGLDHSVAGEPTEPCGSFFMVGPLS